MIQRDLTYSFNDRGFAIIEHLVALLLIMIVMSAAVRQIASSQQANSVYRTEATLLSDVIARIEEYREQPFIEFVGEFWPTCKNGNTEGCLAAGTRIPDGDVVVTAPEYNEDARATITTTFTAETLSTSHFPDAVRVQVLIEQRRLSFGTKTAVFETIISNTNKL
jgi:type II secretory pathway pseudopilin PulG